MQVVPLHPKHDHCDLAKTLRNIADDLEAGRYDFEPTLGVLVLANESERIDRDGRQSNFLWQSHGLGEKCTTFAARGILASAVSSFSGIGG